MSSDPCVDSDPIINPDGFVTVPGSFRSETVLIAVLDTSGSMSEPASNAQSVETGGVVFSRLDLVKHSMRTLVGMLYDNANTSLGIVAFDSAARTGMPTVPMKGETALEAANQAIDSLYPGGATNIWDGLRLAIQEAEEVYKRNSHAQIHICLLTDGEPTETLLPPGGLRQTLRNKLQKSTPMTIHTFGFGYRLDSKLLYDLGVIGNGIYGYIPDCSMVASVFINYCSTILSKGSVTISNEAFETGRHMLVSVLKEIVVDGAGHCPDVGKNPFTQVQEYLATVLDTTENDMCMALINDIDSSDPNKGQLMKALSCYDWFQRWGYNHLLAYGRALELGVCANFKDQALQLFATDSFKAVQEKGNEIFSEIPAPIPVGYTQASFSAMATATGFSMDMFNTADGGCFSGDCVVSLGNNVKKLVKECVKGDVLDNGSVIRCVVRRRVGRLVKMVRFPLGLLITPWHPVRPGPTLEWRFPCLWMNNVEKVYMEEFYDMVLEGKEQWATINGLQVITLAHGVKNDPVASHEFYGTQQVIKDLKEVKGWDEGYITL